MKRQINIKDYQNDSALFRQNQNTKNFNNLYQKTNKSIISPKTKTVNVKPKPKQSLIKNQKKYETTTQLINEKKSPLIKSIKLSTKKGSCSNLSYLILMNDGQKKQHFNSTKANSRSNIKSSYMTKEEEQDQNNNERFLTDQQNSIKLSVNDKDNKITDQYLVGSNQKKQKQSKYNNINYYQEQQFKNIQVTQSNNNQSHTEQNNLDFSFQNLNDQNLNQQQIIYSNRKFQTYKMTSPLILTMSYGKQNKDKKIIHNSINKNKYQKQLLNNQDKKNKVYVKNSSKNQKNNYYKGQSFLQNRHENLNIKNSSIQNINFNNKTINNNKKKKKRVVSYSDYLKILDSGNTIHNNQNKKMLSSLNQQNKLISNKNCNTKIFSNLNNDNQNIMKINVSSGLQDKKNTVIKKQIVLSLIRNNSSMSKHSLQKTKKQSKLSSQIKKKKQLKEKNKSKLKNGKSYLYRNNSSINHMDQYIYSTSNLNTNTLTKQNMNLYNKKDLFFSQYHQFNNHFVSSNYQKEDSSLSHNKKIKNCQQNYFQYNINNKTDNSKHQTQFYLQKSHQQNQNDNYGQLRIETLLSNKKNNANTYQFQKQNKNEYIYLTDTIQTIHLLNKKQYHLQQLKLQQQQNLQQQKLKQQNFKINQQQKRARPRKISLKQLKQSYVHQNKKYQQLPYQNELINGPISMIQLNTKRQASNQQQYQTQNKFTSSFQIKKQNQMKILYMKTLRVLNRYQKQLRQAKAEIKYLKSKQKINTNVNETYKKTQQTRREVYKKR